MSCAHDEKARDEQEKCDEHEVATIDIIPIQIKSRKAERHARDERNEGGFSRCALPKDAEQEYRRDGWRDIGNQFIDAFKDRGVMAEQR